MTAEERPRRPTFFLEFTAMFAAVALALSLAGGFAITHVVGNDIRNRTLDDLQSDVSQVTARQVTAHLSREQLAAPLTGNELAAFDQYVRENVLSSRTLRLNLWNREGTIVYSSTPGLIGARVPENEGLREALQGQTFTKIEGAEEEGSATEEGTAGLEGASEMVEMYVPLSFSDNGAVVGAIEVNRDYSPIASHIAALQRTVFLSIAAALGALYVALLVLVRRGSNTLRRQQAALHRHTDELRSSYESIVAVLCAALDLRDNVTHGHALRVSELSSVVAWQMGLRKEEVRQIEKAAILHDIGKIGVADAVLSKPGALTEAEWAEMKRHPELGYQILEGIDFLKDVAEIVRAHHERFDGGGYPRGLRGEDIPLGARIFAVVDAYDAMTSHRPYRKAIPHNKAVQEIARNAGTQFDPEVVNAFLEAERRGLLNGKSHQDGSGQRMAALAGVEV
ncbi:MAG: HD-GYP domain-containing protein [Chloroflexi bacterium]|nr:HD-GYP domain-containing protein [Chloroflexota bacterium]